MRGADVFIGVSGPDLVSVEDIKLMAADPMVFALANPDPEIEPEAAMSCARIVATGRSDYPNQINNVLCFPGLFRGMFDVRALRVTEAMKIAAARAIADIIPADHIRPDYIIPSVFDKRVAADVAKAVAKAAIEGGVAVRERRTNSVATASRSRSGGTRRKPQPADLLIPRPVGLAPAIARRNLREKP